MSDYDEVLGLEIHNLLVSKKLETPFLYQSQCLTVETKISMITDCFQDVLTNLGMDLKDPSIQDTPRRLAKMYVNELCGNLDPAKFPRCTRLPNEMAYDEIVLVRDIEVKSLCEHHFVPIDGFAHVAYLPGPVVIGLSKINRVVSYFARRPQIQERLTEQVSLALRHVLQTDDVAVILTAKHYCVKFRGVEDPCSDTTTSKIAGKFKDNTALRAELLALINQGRH